MASSNKKQKQHFRFTLREVRSLQRRATRLELSHETRKRLRWFEYFLSHGRNVSLTCRYYGIARSTFLRWANRFDASDIATLEDRSRQPHTVRAPETPVHVIALIKNYRKTEPMMSKERIAERLKVDYGMHVSTATVGRVIKRQGFFFAETTAHRLKRQEALKHQQSVGFEQRDTETQSDTPPDMLGEGFGFSPQFSS